MNSGWFTVPELYRFTDESMQRAKKGAEDPPTFLDPDLALDYKPPNRLFAPSETILRRIVDRMVTDGKLHTMTWHKEVGRPAVLYYSDEMPPLLPGARCGQCAFYISLYKHCRLWSLLGKSIGIGDPRWKSDGDHPLTSFELYKMKNAWKISPHASACSKFVDKKRDYSLKLLPDTCDICAQPLPATRGKLVLCTNCRTRYSATEKSVRVLTAYEDRFEKTYEELSGHSASLDITRLRERARGAGSDSWKRSISRRTAPLMRGRGLSPSPSCSLPETRCSCGTVSCSFSVRAEWSRYRSRKRSSSTTAFSKKSRSQSCDRRESSSGLWRSRWRWAKYRL